MSRELMVLFSLMGLYSVWVLLPLVPAILIYLLFPSTSVAVSGPLANLTVRASGAFAAYLVVFAASYPLVQTTKETIGGFQRQFWTLSGNVKLLGTNGKETNSKSLLGKLEFTTNPNPHTHEGGVVKLRIMETGEGDLPLVTFHVGDFGNRVIDLGHTSYEIKRDPYHKTIEIKDPIIIQEDPPGGLGLPATIGPQVDDGPQAGGAQAIPRDQ
jgi:hypothetical protein